MSEAQQSYQALQRRMASEQQRIIDDFERKARGVVENAQARAAIDAEIAARKEESARKKKADDARRRALDVERIAATLRAVGASEDEARDLAERIRTERLIADAQRSGANDADDSVTVYMPLM